MDLINWLWYSILLHLLKPLVRLGGDWLDFPEYIHARLSHSDRMPCELLVSYHMWLRHLCLLPSSFHHSHPRVLARGLMGEGRGYSHCSQAWNWCLNSTIYITLQRTGETKQTTAKDTTDRSLFQEISLSSGLPSSSVGKQLTRISDVANFSSKSWSILLFFFYMYARITLCGVDFIINIACTQLDFSHHMQLIFLFSG